MAPVTRNPRRFKRLARTVASLALAAVVLGGCGNRDDAIQQIGAEQLYRDGAEQLRSGNYVGAISTFRNLTIRFPFSPAARQAQLDLLHAHYRSGQPEAALDVAEQFIRENPRLPEVAYCLYMIGLIRFDREPNIIERVFRVDVTERPPRESQLAFDAFQQLVREYPDSPFVENARQRMVFLRNRLAIYENHVARYYMQRGAWVAAINRAKYSIEHYPGAPQLEESLDIMIESYDMLGMTELADDARRVRARSFGELAANAD
jgi:outer membrane protein assembly factor BamD